MVEEVRLDFYSGYTAAYLFLCNLADSLYQQDIVSDKDKNELGAIIGVAFNSPCWEADWEDAVSKFYGKK